MFWILAALLALGGNAAVSVLKSQFVAVQVPRLHAQGHAPTGLLHYEVLADSFSPSPDVRVVRANGEHKSQTSINSYASRFEFGTAKRNVEVQLVRSSRKQGQAHPPISTPQLEVRPKLISG